MGEAKKRGSKEQRVEEGINKNNKLREERIRKAKEEENALTPEERIKRNNARQTLAMITGLISGMNV